MQKSTSEHQLTSQNTALIQHGGLPSKTIDLSKDADMNQVFEQLVSIHRRIESLKQEQDALKEHIQAVIKDYSHATFRHGQISWKHTKDTVYMDIDQLLIDHPTIALEYSSTMPGPRKLLIQCNKNIST